MGKRFTLEFDRELEPELFRAIATAMYAQGQTIATGRALEFTVTTDGGPDTDRELNEYWHQNGIQTQWEPKPATT